MKQIRARVAQSWASRYRSMTLDKPVIICVLYLEWESKCWFHTRIRTYIPGDRLQDERYHLIKGRKIPHCNKYLIV